jgi:hypothetical protein
MKLFGAQQDKIKAFGKRVKEEQTVFENSKEVMNPTIETDSGTMLSRAALQGTSELAQALGVSLLQTPRTATAHPGAL